MVNDERNKFEVVEDDVEVVGDDVEQVSYNDVEVVEDDIEIVESDEEVVAKPIFKLTPHERKLNAIYRFKILSERIKRLEEMLEAYITILKECGLKYDTYKLKRKIHEIKEELAKLKYERMQCRVEIFLNCEQRKISPKYCDKCEFKKECMLAYNYLNKMREKKVKSWLFKK